ncbi:hypothetical protein C8Q74DRAFT_288559 [Fomes fomentarius]|nr:hypothetical protein C8Q74DRAFT_288559 [Fomes fomentarius]
MSDDAELTTNLSKVIEVEGGLTALKRADDVLLAKVGKSKRVQARILCTSLLGPEFGFGFGRRICPGKDLAENSVWAMIANLFHVFRIAPAVDAEGKAIPILTEFEEHAVRCVWHPLSAVMWLKCQWRGRLTISTTCVGQTPAPVQVQDHAAPYDFMRAGRQTSKLKALVDT